MKKLKSSIDETLPTSYTECNYSDDSTLSNVVGTYTKLSKDLMVALKGQTYVNNLGDENPYGYTECLDIVNGWMKKNHREDYNIYNGY